MTAPDRPRVALVGRRSPAALAAALRVAGHDVTRIAPPPLEPLERLLGRRGFTGPLTQLPQTIAIVGPRRFDVVHAFAAPEAAAMALVSRAPGGVVFPVAEVLDRSTVADRRLRLRLLEAALDRSDVVLAASAAAATALERWMAVEADVLSPADPGGHAALYAGLARRG